MLKATGNNDQEAYAEGVNANWQNVYTWKVDTMIRTE